eukprot:GILI01012280.1.p1 GENE.GILI01012280.1~~GILI01012280.1.p1  ORF type:complete len:148 (+),score=34.18 GILI01012280.1:55-498(+)
MQSNRQSNSLANIVISQIIWLVFPALIIVLFAWIKKAFTVTADKANTEAETVTINQEECTPANVQQKRFMIDVDWQAKVAGDPFLAMIHDIAVEQGYSKGALAVLMSDLPESMLDVKALPTKHHRLALDAEVKEAREEAESKAAITN